MVLYRTTPNKYKSRTTISGLVQKDNVDGIIKKVRTQGFNDLADEAYNTKKGYEIGFVNGEKIMYVSGSRNIFDWTFNAIDGVLPHKAQVFSNRTAKNLDRIAKKEKVDLVVGHSRGAHLVSKMHGPYEKLGLDGAMMLARKKDKNMMNISQKQVLDRFIGMGGKRNRYRKVRKWKNAHFISRDYKGYKQKYSRKKRYADSFINPFFNPYS